MAIWQFDFYFLPLEKLQEKFSQIPVTISGENFRNERWWRGVKSPPNIQEKLDALLPRGDSWLPNLIIWGDEDETRVDVYFSEINVKVIFVRIDVRNINIELVAKLLDVAEYCNCYLFCPEDLTLIPPELNLALIKIKKSRAFLYSHHTVEWLNRLIEDNTVH